MEKELSLVHGGNLLVGENPMWDARRGELFFLDIRGKCIYRKKVHEREFRRVLLPQQIGCMTLCESGGLLVALEDGVYYLEDNGDLRPAHSPVRIKGRRFNDGKVGPDGAFYLGTTDDDGKGAFYRLQNGVLRELFEGCFCSNGLDWSADGETMYYIDTMRHQIELFDFDGTDGSLHNRRKFMDIPEEWGLPDGMTLDAEGHLWVALWGGGAVIRIDKEHRRVLRRIELPAPKASCPVFGGEQMNELFITTAAWNEDISVFPAAGNTFRISLDVCGRRMNYFKG